MDLNIVESGFRSNVVQMFAITKYALSHMKKGDSLVSSNYLSFAVFDESGDLLLYQDHQ